MQLNSSGAQQFWTAISFDPVTGADRSALAGSNYAAFVRNTDAWYGADDFSARYGGTNVSGLLSAGNSAIAKQELAWRELLASIYSRWWRYDAGL